MPKKEGESNGLHLHRVDYCDCIILFPRISQRNKVPPHSNGITWDIQTYKKPCKITKNIFRERLSCNTPDKPLYFYKNRDAALTTSLFLLYFFSLLGFAGNHPFSTLFFCWNTSPMLQKEENATTPKSIEIVRSATSNDATTDRIPSNRKSHQLFTPM